jgi:hypothetical protein
LRQPFDREEFADLDEYSLKELSKRAPEAFVEGTVNAFISSIGVINHNIATKGWDYSFSHRNSGDFHSGSDSFLDMFRTALRAIAVKTPALAETFLLRIDPNSHEACTHIWLETIAANGSALSHLLHNVLGSSHLMEAGWTGAEWKSFADAVASTIALLPQADVDTIVSKITSYRPELDYASKALAAVQQHGENDLQTKQGVRQTIKRSGHEQWSVMETIGTHALPPDLQPLFAQLRRKFAKSEISKPHKIEARWVGSPIQQSSAERMKDDDWLGAIKQYGNEPDPIRRRARGEGGARELAVWLQHFTKANPTRFVKLLEMIPNEAPITYINHILWGLTEAPQCPPELVRAAVVNAHSRPNRPYGSEIARLIAGTPEIAADSEVFAILAWYMEFGTASDESVQITRQEKPIATIEDVLQIDQELHSSGINGERGMAAEALSEVIWKVPAAVAPAWPLLERRAKDEQLRSVKCCLVRPTIGLFNGDHKRASLLFEHLSQPSQALWGFPLFQSIWRYFSFPSTRLHSGLQKLSITVAGLIEWTYRKVNAHQTSAMPTWWAALTTQKGVYLFPFIQHWEPEIAKRLLFTLLVGGDETARFIGAWHAFRRSFQDAGYAPLANALSDGGVTYRRLLANLAAQAVPVDEFRHRAEAVVTESFNDEDEEVRSQAAGVFRNLDPKQFARHRTLALNFLDTKAFATRSWGFYDALEKATCKVDDIVVPAAERLLSLIEKEKDANQRRATDLHDLQDILIREYSNSESDPALRKRLLDLIDRMFKLELYGVDNIAKAHER